MWMSRSAARACLILGCWLAVSMTIGRNSPNGYAQNAPDLQITSLKRHLLKILVPLQSRPNYSPLHDRSINYLMTHLDVKLMTCLVWLLCKVHRLRVHWVGNDNPSDTRKHESYAKYISNFPRTAADTAAMPLLIEHTCSMDLIHALLVSILNRWYMDALANESNAITITNTLNDPMPETIKRSLEELPAADISLGI